MTPPDHDDASDLDAFRDELLAVLAHDLRNPLQSIITGAELLAEGRLDEKQGRVVSRVRGSAQHMTELIDLAMDFARARVAGGLALDRSHANELPAFLEHAVSTLRAANPEREIHSVLALADPVSCDAHRVAQLLGSLLVNALLHGTPGTPITVTATSERGRLELSVHNHGSIPDGVPPQLPPLAEQGAADARLGLGLYLAAEIARAHDGTLVASDAGSGTTFTFRMPSAS